MRKFNAYLGAAISAWLLAIMVILSELSPSFKEFLKGTFTHHWLGKLIITVAAFLIFGWLLRNEKSMFGSREDKFAWQSMIGSLIVTLLFFMIYYFME